MHKDKIMSGGAVDGSAGRNSQQDTSVMNKSVAPKTNNMSSTGHNDIAKGKGSNDLKPASHGNQTSNSQ